MIVDYWPNGLVRVRIKHLLCRCLWIFKNQLYRHKTAIQKRDNGLTWMKIVFLPELEHRKDRTMVPTLISMKTYKSTSKLTVAILKRWHMHSFQLFFCVCLTLTLTLNPIFSSPELEDSQNWTQRKLDRSNTKRTEKIWSTFANTVFFRIFCLHEKGFPVSNCENRGKSCIKRDKNEIKRTKRVKIENQNHVQAIGRVTSGRGGGKFREESSLYSTVAVTSSFGHGWG